MRIRRVLSVLFLAVFAVPFLYLAAGGGGFSWGQAGFTSGRLGHTFESSVEEAFPFGRHLRQNVATLQTLFGRNGQGGCFYSENSIIQNLAPADEAITKSALQTLQNYAENHAGKCCFMLLPTAASIEQKQIPSLALSSLFNQKEYIESCYRALAPYGQTVDAYANLFSHQGEYLYYRTDTRLTSFGNYYVYQSAVRQLGLTPRSMDYYNVSYPSHQFRGNLAALVPYAQIPDDSIALFLLQVKNRTLSLVQNPLDDAKVYSTVYDTAMLDSADPLQVFLGKKAAVVDLVPQEMPYDNELLVFTDGSCNPAIILMAAHFTRVRVVNLGCASAQDIENLDVNSFDQILFAFSVENFGYDAALCSPLAK